MREELASLQHDIWSQWMRYMFKVCESVTDGSILIPVGVIAAGHSALPEDGETRMECSKPDDCPYGDNNLDRCAGGCRYIEQVGYIWQNIEFFLTVKGAEEYIKADGHNHGKLRTYIKYFNQRNYEMNDFLREAGFKCTD